MNHIALILNPGSCAGRGRQRWKLWLDGLKRTPGISFECRETSALADARRIVGELRHANTIVAVGGDGTINGVLSGLMDLPEPRPTMGILYAGTSPDFCRFHCIPTDPDRALDTLFARRVRAVDVARVQYHDEDGSPRTASFGSSANIGIGARIARLSNCWRPRVGDALGTGLAVLSSIRGPHPRLTVQLDQSASFDLPNCCNLTVAKNPFIASGLKFDAAMSSDDGSLAVLGVYDRGFAGLMALLPSFYTGTVSHRRGVMRGECRCAKITSNTVCPVEFDGDPHGFLPVTIDIQPKALRLIVGENAMNEYEMIRRLLVPFSRNPHQRNAPFECDSELLEIAGELWAVTVDEFSPAEDCFPDADPIQLGRNLVVATLSDLLACGARAGFLSERTLSPSRDGPRLRGWASREVCPKMLTAAGLPLMRR